MTAPRPPRAPENRQTPGRIAPRATHSSRTQTALPAWMVVLIALLAAALAVGVYDFWLRRQEREVVRTAVRDAAAMLEAQRQQKQDAAVRQALRMERLARGVSSAAMLRTGVAEYLADKGELPGEMAQLGHPPDWTPHPAVQSMQLRPGGVIVLRFAPELQLDGEVVLTPEADTAYGMIRNWRCTSSDFEFITQALPDCQFTQARP